MQVFADIRSWENGEELVMDIFMPEAVLPTQLQSQPNKEVWGWRQLWLAVMVDAVCCINKGTDDASKRTARLAAEAWAWVDSDEMSITSFQWICQVLDLEPAVVRAGIQQMTPGVLVKAEFAHRCG